MISIPEPETFTFDLPDGRRLSYCFYGAPLPPTTAANASSPSPVTPTTPTQPTSPLVVFYFHSYPASRHEAGLLHKAAVHRSITIVSFDRPGMGDSTFLPQRRILDLPLDVLALADHLGIRRFACVGSSGGGPYVLACYHKIPRARMPVAAIVSGMYPRSLGTDGMLIEARLMLYLAPWAPGLVSAGLDWGMGNLARDKDHPEAFAAAIEKYFDGRPEIDRLVWRDDQNGCKATMLRSLREALRNGSEGAGHEMKLYGSDWGFDLSDVRVDPGSMVVWHGGLDRNVPVAMAQKAAELMSVSEFELFPEDGHLTLIVNKGDEILEKVQDMMDKKT